MSTREKDAVVHRFLHLSDIHFGQENKDGTIVKHESVRDALISDVKTLAKKRGPASRVLVTGDTAYSGKQDEYKTATEWLEKVTAACGCDETHVSPIPGNHDYDVSAEAPRALYDREPPVLPDLLDTLLLYTRRSFTDGLEDSLVRVLQRSRAETRPEVRQILCTKLLRFAFDNVSLPMGQVVAETFADVYAVAIKKNVEPPSFWSALFGTYDWDKGKDLRNSLVDAFSRSRWAPGDLAIAATRAGILRKIFKRLHRQTRGDEYIRRMQQDLSRRTDKSALQATENLTPLIADPDFYEEWD